MASPDAQELKTRATQLRNLAEHVESLPSRVRDFVMHSMKDWSGPHADRTRGEVNNWRTACRNAAEVLRQEARQCEDDAKGLENKK